MLLFQVVFGFFAFLGVFVAGGLLCKYLGAWVFLVLPVLFGLVAVGIFGSGASRARGRGGASGATR